MPCREKFHPSWKMMWFLRFKGWYVAHYFLSGGNPRRNWNDVSCFFWVTASNDGDAEQTSSRQMINNDKTFSTRSNKKTPISIFPVRKTDFFLFILSILVKYHRPTHRWDINKKEKKDNGFLCSKMGTKKNQLLGFRRRKRRGNFVDFLLERATVCLAKNQIAENRRWRRMKKVNAVIMMMTTMLIGK